MGVGVPIFLERDVVESVQKQIERFGDRIRRVEVAVDFVDDGLWAGADCELLTDDRILPHDSA